jgi:hypothetical protein
MVNVVGLFSGDGILVDERRVKLFGKPIDISEIFERFEPGDCESWVAIGKGSGRRLKEITESIIDDIVIRFDPPYVDDCRNRARVEFHGTRRRTIFGYPCRVTLGSRDETVGGLMDRIKSGMRIPRRSLQPTVLGFRRTGGQGTLDYAKFTETVRDVWDRLPEPREAEVVIEVRDPVMWETTAAP